MRIMGTESECPRCHRKFEDDFRFECPFCGGLIPKGSVRCPTCQIDLHNFGGHDRESVEQKTDTIMNELIQLESSLIKQEKKQLCCPDCSCLLKGTESKCPKCGRALVGENGLTCPICMAPIRKDAKECGRCGAILRAEKATQTRSQGPARPPAPTTPPGPPAIRPIKPGLSELESLLKCPHCGASAKMEATVCPKCNRSLVEKEAPAPPEEIVSDEATKALQTLGEIERQVRKRKSRKLRAGKVTTVEARTIGPGRGLSNGLGQTNGTGRVNGRSKINGTGKVNGRVNGRVNGTGAVNGRSLVNGIGMSNGLRAKANVHSGKRNRMTLRWQFFAVLVAVVITVPTIVYVVYPGQTEPVTVDGDFSEWADAPKFGARTQSGSSSLDIAEWATVDSGTSVYLYVRTEAVPMASGEPECFYLFIDSDGSADTGYRADSIGADYMLKFEGWNGSVQHAETEDRAQGADQYDWNSWENAGPAQATGTGTGIEAKGVLPIVPSASARYVLVSKDSADRTAITYAAPSEGGLLIVELEPSAEAADGVIPSAPSVSIMSARFTCQGSSGFVSEVIPTLSGASPASQIQGFSLSPGGERVMEISIDSSNAAAEQLVTANLLSSSFESDFAAVQITGQPVSVYVGSSPQGIVIDGVFEDWAGKTTIDEDSSQSKNANIDIDSTGNFSTSQSSFFYISVQGELVKGSCVPAFVRKTSGTGGGDHGVPARKTGEDILRVYIDSDSSPSTGLGTVYGSRVIGADHMIEVLGINGRITSSSSWNFSGGNWIQSSVVVLSAKDYSQIEIGVDSILVNGRQDIDFIAEATCWKDEFDRACYNPTGTRTITAHIAGNAHIESWVGGISTSSLATSMSYQRKLFWDGTNFWSFYFDGSDTVCKYSDTGGTTWTSRGAVFTTTGVTEASVWYDSVNNVVYAVGDTGTASSNVYIQKGTVTPSTHSIAWATSDSTLTTSTYSLAGKNTFISRDASGYIWVMSANCTATTPASYDLSVFKSTSLDNIAGTWTVTGGMLVNSAQSTVKGCVLPTGTGSDMWAVYVYSGTVASKKYTGTWGTESVLHVPTGLGENTENAPPSALVDTRGVLHVIYGNDHEQPTGTSKPHIYYRYNTGSAWSAAVALSSTAANQGFKYPTISLDTSSGNLYAFWYDMQTQYVVAKRNVSGTWSAITLNSQTADPKAYLTSVYSVPSPSLICYQWTQNTTAPIHVVFDKIPEFEDVLLPMLLAIFLCMALRRRARALIDTWLQATTRGKRSSNGSACT